MRRPSKPIRNLETRIDLPELARQHGYQLDRDDSGLIAGQTEVDRAWLWQLPCSARNTHIYIHGVDLLAVHCGAPRLHAAIIAIPGVQVIRRGDKEITATFPPDLLPAVAEVVHVRRQRRLSPEHKAKLLAAGSAHRFSADRHPGVEDGAPTDEQLSDLAESVPSSRSLPEASWD